MDIFVQVVQWVWRTFLSIAIPITFQGVTYNITLYAMFLFTTIVGIVAVLISKAFD